MKDLVVHKRFERDLSRLLKQIRPQRFDYETLDYVIDLLMRDKPLPESFRPHALQKRSVNYAGVEECHLDADVLLLYKLLDDCVVLWRIGTHSFLFAPGKFR